jgi:hypothetical protein
VNYHFNIEDWLPRLPLNPENGRFSGEIITSPYHICNNEQLRQEAHDQFEWGPAVPVDVFVMAEGEPPDRHVTKIGGLPYWPAHMPWPTADDGTPMSFVAQINFADSKDLTGDLPGDVLLLFTSDSDGCVETLHCDWQPLGLGNLISGSAIPDQVWRPDPCYGHICRTANYPEARQKPEITSKYPMCRGLEIWSDHCLLQYQATQIGTAPFFIQPGDDDLPGRMLCAISSVQPPRHEAYPWVNHAEPLMPRDVWRYDDNYLMLGDMGCIYISIDETGELHFTQSCY